MIVCSTERSTPGSTKGSERASFLTLSTVVNPELEESLTQFHRIAYSSNPSRLLHSPGPPDSVTSSSPIGVTGRAPASRRSPRVRYAGAAAGALQRALSLLLCLLFAHTLPSFCTGRSSKLTPLACDRPINSR